MKSQDLKSGELYAIRGSSSILYKIRLLDNKPTAQRRSTTNWGNNWKYIKCYPAEIWNEERYVQRYSDGHSVVFPARWMTHNLTAREILAPWNDDHEREYQERISKAAASEEAKARSGATSHGPTDLIFLFAGVHYYPAGGVDDFIGIISSMDEAIAKLNEDQDNQWAQAAQIKDNQLVTVKAWRRDSVLSRGIWEECYAASTL